MRFGCGGQLRALAALNLAAFASDLDLTALSGEVDFQATYAAEQYLVLGVLFASDSEVITATPDLAVSLGYSVG